MNPFIVVEPGNPNSTHDISLSDGLRTVGLNICDSNGVFAPHLIKNASVDMMALKTTSGNQKYSDYNPPWSPVAQSDFSGGMGKADFDDDTTRYWYGRGINATMPGKVILGGMEGYSYGAHKNQEYYLPCGNSVSPSSTKPTGLSWMGLYHTGIVAAMFTSAFAASASYTVGALGVYVRRRGLPPSGLVVSIGTTSTGAELGSFTITTVNIPDTLSELYYGVPSPAVALTSGSTYYVRVETAIAGDTENHWEIGDRHTYVSGMTIHDPTPYFHITESAYTSWNRTTLFIYKNLLYMITGADTIGVASNLYRNGDRGCADSNAGALSTLVDATKTWTTDEWVGCVVKLIAGPGCEEDVPYRTITGNNGTTLTVNTPWLTTHTTATDYVILGSDKWTLVDSAATTGIAQPVTGVCIVQGSVWITQANGVNPRRWEWYNNAGTATNRYAAEAGTTAPILKRIRNSTGAIEIWSAYFSTNWTVAKATPTNWGSNLTMASPLSFIDEKGRITGMIGYDLKAYTFREGGINPCTTFIDEFGVGELQTVMDYTNGRASAVIGFYLYFNLAGRLERYYNGSLDNVGPDKDDGLPPDCTGIVTEILGYPGALIISYDGGVSNYSSIFIFNGTGWHPLYRAPMKGMRITSMCFQTIPGTIPDRLWFNVGTDICYVPFPSNAFNPLMDTSYPFTHEGVLESGWIMVGLMDAYKQFQALKLFTENLSVGAQIVEADFKINEDTAWTPLSEIMTVSPVDKKDFSKYPLQNARRIKFRLRLMTDQKTTTPIVKATAVDNISQSEVKYAVRFSYRKKKGDTDLRGNPDMDADEKQAIIKEWSEKLTPLTMRSRIADADNRKVWIYPPSWIPSTDNTEPPTLIEELVVTER